MSDSGRAVLVIGTGMEKEICRAVAHAHGSVDACGSLSLMETAAVLKRAAVLVTNDSAPLHISEAVGTPVVALFGPTVSQFGYFPLLEESEALEKEIDCRPCSRNGARPCHIEKRDCLDTIGPREVIAAVNRILGSTGE
jgi:heptosyltransferase-2